MMINSSRAIEREERGIQLNALDGITRMNRNSQTFVLFLIHHLEHEFQHNDHTAGR